MATPDSTLTQEERRKKLNELFQDMLDGKISEEEFNTYRREVLPELYEVRPFRPRVPPVVPYFPKSDVSSAQLDLIRTLTHSYQSNQNLSPEAAREKAIIEVNKTIKPTTLEFEEPLGDSLIPFYAPSKMVDVEKKIIEDQETGELRKADSWEAFWDSLKKQTLATTKEYEDVRKMQNYIQSLEQQQKEEEFEKPHWSKTSVIKDPLRWLEFYSDLFKNVPEIDYAGPGDWDVIPYPKAAEEVIKEALIEPSITTGMVTESSLGAALRGAVTIPSAAVAAGMETMMPGMQETDDYRMADSQDVIDQFIVNVAKGQGIPQLLQSNKHIADLLGETGAFWYGVGLELFVPAGPELPIRAALAGTKRATNAVKVKAIQSEVDSMFEAVNLAGPADKTSKEILKDLNSLSAKEKGHGLRQVASETVGEKIATVNTLRAAVDVAPIKIDDLGMLSTFPTTKAILKEIEINTGKVPLELNRANAGPILTRELKAFDKAAEVDPNFRVLVEESKEIQKLIKEGKRLSGTPTRIKTTRPTKEFQDQLARTQIAKQIAKGKNPAKELARAFSWATRMGRNYRKAELTKVLLDKRFKIDASVADFGDIALALQTSIARKLQTRMLNSLPDDLIVVAGDMVYNKNLVSRQAQKNFKEAQQKRNNKIEFDEKNNLYKVDPSEARALTFDIIDFLGVSRIRESANYRELLSKLNVYEYDPKFDNLIRAAGSAKNAKEHLKAFKLMDGGTQYQRALRPLESRGDIIDLSVAENPLTQLRTGSVARFNKDLINSVKILVSKKIENPLFKIKIDIRPPPAFVRLQKTLSSKIDNIYENFKKDLLRRYREFGDGKVALDDLCVDTWNQESKKKIDAINSTVQKQFNGDYLQYSRMYEDPDIFQQIKNQIEINKIKDPNKIKEIVLDYGLFFMKNDTWESIARTFYGPKFDVNIKPIKNFKEWIKKDDSSFRPVASHILDISFTNWEKIISRIDAAHAGWEGKGLRKGLVWTERYSTVPVMEWLLGIRRGKVVSKMLNDFLENHPTYRIELLTEYSAKEMQLDLRPLVRDYERILYQVVSKAGPIKGTSKDVLDASIKKSAEILANKQFDIISKISPGKQSQLISALFTKYGTAETLDTGLDTIKDKIIRIFSVEFDLMINALNEHIDALVTTKKVVDVRKDARNELWNIFFKSRPIDGRYYAAPTIGVFEDIRWRLKSFFQSNGISIENSIIGKIDDNFPRISSIPDSSTTYSPYALVHIEKDFPEIKTLLELSKSSKLRNTMQKLKVADEGASDQLLSLIDSFFNNSRQLMTQGMLSGVWRKNLGYSGMNIFSFPFISAATIGLERTLDGMRHLLMSINEMPTRLKNQTTLKWLRDAITIVEIPSDRVVFTSAQGRKYTARELRSLESEYNLGMTRGQIEFQEGSAGEILGSIGLRPSGKPDPFGPSDTLLSILRDHIIKPWQRNLFSKADDAMDLMFRRAVFYGALANDLPLIQAIELAKKSVLNYGALSAFERNRLSRYAMFWSFRRQMLLETVNSFSKSVIGGAGASYLARAIRVSMRQQQDVESWLHSNDDAKTRLYSIYKGIIDDSPVHTYGLVNPIVESFESWLSIFELVGALGTDDIDYGSFFNRKVREGAGALYPDIKFILDSYEGKYQKSVPADIIWTAKNLGMWDQMKQVYDISPKPLDWRKPGEPLFDDNSYRMSKDGAWLYGWSYLMITLLGFQRSLRDEAKEKMAEGVAPDVGKVDFKRYRTPHPWLYAFGLERSLPTQNALSEAYRNSQKIEKELLQKIQEKKQ